MHAPRDTAFETSNCSSQGSCPLHNPIVSLGGSPSSRRLCCVPSNPSTVIAVRSPPISGPEYRGMIRQSPSLSRPPTMPRPWPPPIPAKAVSELKSSPTPKNRAIHAPRSPAGHHLQTSNSTTSPPKPSLPPPPTTPPPYTNTQTHILKFSRCTFALCSSELFSSSNSRSSLVSFSSVVISLRVHQTSTRRATSFLAPQQVCMTSRVMVVDGIEMS